MRTYVRSAGRHGAAPHEHADPGDERDQSAARDSATKVARHSAEAENRRESDGRYYGQGSADHSRVSQRRQMLDEQADGKDAFSSLDAALHGVSTGDHPDRADRDHQAEQDYPQPPEPTEARPVPLANGYAAEMRDVLRRLNIQAPARRRWFLWGVRSRFEVGLRLARPRLSDELLAVHLDAFNSAAKAIESEDRGRQQETGHPACTPRRYPNIPKLGDASA